MSQDELAGMLQRNHRDLEETGQLEDMLSSLNASMMAGGGVGGKRAMGASSTLPRRIVGAMFSIVLAVVQTASVQMARHPRQCTLLAGMFLVTLLAVRNAPRNGIVLSTGLSRGHTTILAPPVEYMMRYYVDRDDWESSLPPAPILVEDDEATAKMKMKKKIGKANKRSSSIAGVGMTRSLPLLFMDNDSSSSSLSSGSSFSDDGVTLERVEREGYALIATARKTISLDSDILQQLPRKPTMDDDDDESGAVNEEGYEHSHQEAIQCMHDAVISVFDDRKFSEFIPQESCFLKFRSFLVASEEEERGGEEDDDKQHIIEGAVMAMKSLGDFGLYGIQPLCFSYEEDGTEQNDDEGKGATDDNKRDNMIRCLAFHTVKGGHFDGEIRFSIHESNAPTRESKSKKSKKKTDPSTPGITIAITLAVPDGGRAPPPRLADLMISSLLRSITHSSTIKMRQTIARRLQSKSYRADASGRASEKRHLRYEQEKFQEEMSAERKRRWKRNNPDAGHYRPSGHRLRSPNNC